MAPDIQDRDALRKRLPAGDANDSRARAASWVFLFVMLAGLLQFLIPYPIEDDTAYHFSVARLIRHYGVLHEFPWTPFSWQADHYADKEFLFHLLFVPFVGTGFVTASRIVGTLGGALVLCAVYLILRAEKVKFSGPWTLVVLTCSPFVWRLALVRPHLFSITLALVVAWAYARGRLRILFLAAVLYPLAYVAFWQIPLIVVVAGEAAGTLSGERLRWKPALVLLAGLALGVALHPNSVNLLVMNWIHMSDILFRNAWARPVDFGLGTEFEPYAFEHWVTSLALVCIMALGACVFGWRDRRLDSTALSFSLAAAAFWLLTLLSQRFIEYFAPFAVAGLALAVRRHEKRPLPHLLLAVSLLLMLAFGREPFRVLAAADEPLKPDIAQSFEQIIPAGAQVFTCGWDYTGALMLALPERRFIVAGDPTLFYRKDPRLFEIWGRMPVEAPAASAGIVRRLFRARFVLSKNFREYDAFFSLLAADSRVTLLYADDQWVLFDMGAAPGQD